MAAYDQTEVPLEEQDNFVEGVRYALKRELYAAEQSQLLAVQNDLTNGILHGVLTTTELLKTGVLPSLHKQVFEPIWNWAGQYRRLVTNIGVEPGMIPARFAEEMDTMRWFHESRHEPEVIAMQLHLRTVTVHPFVDGNGRITRLYADAVLFSLSGTIFDWRSEGYLTALRVAEKTGDATSLLEVIPVQRFSRKIR